MALEYRCKAEHARRRCRSSGVNLDQYRAQITQHYTSPRFALLWLDPSAAHLQPVSAHPRLQPARSSPTQLTGFTCSHTTLPESPPPVCGGSSELRVEACAGGDFSSEIQNTWQGRSIGGEKKDANHSCCN